MLAVRLIQVRSGTAIVKERVAEATLENGQLLRDRQVRTAKCGAIGNSCGCCGRSALAIRREGGMSSRLNEMIAEEMPAIRQLKKHAPGWCRFISCLFARDAVSEAVVTRIRFNASPEEVWNHIMLYEEVPGRPPFLLRALLPQPIRTEGDKTHVGATVRCVYTEGDLVKRITAVEPPHFLQFEVVEQRLGIEGCSLTLSGSYQVYSYGASTEVVLVTNYLAFLIPRSLWRPLEAILVTQLHRHILCGVHAAILRRDPTMQSSVTESHTGRCAAPGGLACTVSQSCSRR